MFASHRAATAITDLYEPLEKTYHVKLFTQRKIDQDAYESYDPAPEDIAIVEKSAGIDR